MSSPSKRLRIAASHLREPAAWEWIVRFVGGGLVIAATGLVGTRSLALGGIMLAFPSILPASLTLVKRHEGRRKAADDARGARFGTVGLCAFAAVIAGLGNRAPGALVLVAATCAWALAAVLAWRTSRAP